jgi:CO/xanthine dehydrogenase FAD-binding subunit
VTEYHAPTSVAEVIRLLSDGHDGSLVAGGTDLVVGVRQGKRALPPVLIAIDRIEALRGFDRAAGGSLVAGALTTHAQLVASPIVREHWTALADASALVGSPATRAIGTIGGNLVNASPAMETGAPLLVFDAEVELESATGTRTLPVSGLLVGPGSVAMRRDELLTRIRVPEAPAGSGSAYVRLEYRRGMEIAVVGAAALLAVADGSITGARIALTAVAPTCTRAPKAEEALVGEDPSPAAFAKAAEEARQAARPISDVRADAAYRDALVPVIVERALRAAAARARGDEIEVPATRSLAEVA